VLSLAALLSHIAGLLDAPLERTGIHGLDLAAMGKLFEDLGHLETAARLYTRGLTHDLPEELYWRTVRRLSFVQKRCRDLSTAVDLWQQAAHNGHVYAHVELAKFFEHKVHDYGEAARWTKAAITLVTAPGSQGHTRRRWLADLEHRMERLLRKL
jgi:hypothetical protein